MLPTRQHHLAPCRSVHSIWPMLGSNRCSAHIDGSTATAARAAISCWAHAEVDKARRVPTLRRAKAYYCCVVGHTERCTWNRASPLGCARHMSDAGIMRTEAGYGVVNSYMAGRRCFTRAALEVGEAESSARPLVRGKITLIGRLERASQSPPGGFTVGTRLRYIG